jgi:hypothetical protein
MVVVMNVSSTHLKWENFVSNLNSNSQTHSLKKISKERSKHKICKQMAQE